jgi:hypothetical protein
LQPYPVVAADALLEIGTSVISAVSSLDENLFQLLPGSRNVIISRCIVVLIENSLSGYALLNVSRTAANDFDAK